MKYLNYLLIGLLILIGLLPFGFIFSLLTFYFVAANEIGYLPIYSYPDPKLISSYSIYAPYIDWFGGLWICSIPILVILLTLYLRKEVLNKKLLISSLVGHLLAAMLFLSDIMEWFLD